MKRIHIVGSGPRTGTTLLAEAMAACFRIDHVCEHESSICTRLPPAGNCLLTKDPGEAGAVRLPLLLNKDLYVVCIIRDPRDTVVSFHGSDSQSYWAGLRFWKRFGADFDRLTAHRRFIHIRYEDLVTDPDKVQDEIMKRIPFLEKIHNFSAYHRVARPSRKSLEALKELRPIEAKGIGNWKDHLPRIKQQIALHGPISADLVKFGYEPDAAWESCLADVEAGDFVSSRPEFFSPRGLHKLRSRERREVMNILIRALGLGRFITEEQANPGKGRQPPGAGLNDG
ncbi:MAG: sulfotransferase [Gallionellaceae bacterium]|nr:sulfotransferase [Gallionellaceae bacterium]